MRSNKIEIFKKGLKLSQSQREILTGLILGDAHLETQNSGRTYRVKFEYASKNSEYAIHIYEIFKDWVLTPPQLKTDETRSNIWFQTISHSAFRFYAQAFYKDKIKCVPAIIHRLLTERSIAYWYMDDGSIKSKESKGVIFNTQSFSKKDITRLIKTLTEYFGLKSSERRQKEGAQIYISGESYERFMQITEPFIIDSMKYKLPSARRTKMPK
jgi:hypothetical protein